MMASTVVSIEKVGTGRVRNLTVDSNHTFVTASGIVTHNCDYANKNSSQPSLRGVIDEFINNCRFIVTANMKNNIIEPIYSRCPLIEFEFTNKERVEMLMSFVKRLEDILHSQNIVFDRRALATYCKSNFPDFRNTLNNLQMNVINGELELTSLGSSSTIKIEALFSILKEKDYWSMKDWVVNNSSGNDTHLIRRAIYDHIKDYIDGSTIPEAVLLVNKYDFQEGQVVDKQINMVAFLTDLMMTVVFK